jgi:hypothetical protein
MTESMCRLFIRRSIAHHPGCACHNAISDSYIQGINVSVPNSGGMLPSRNTCCLLMDTLAGLFDLFLSHLKWYEFVKSGKPCQKAYGSKSTSRWWNSASYTGKYQFIIQLKKCTFITALFAIENRRVGNLSLIGSVSHSRLYCKGKSDNGVHL